MVASHATSGLTVVGDSEHCASTKTCVSFCSTRYGGVTPKDTIESLIVFEALESQRSLKQPGDTPCVVAAALRSGWKLQLRRKDQCRLSAENLRRGVILR